MNRRGFLFGLGASLIVAPAIVHASNLMPVKPYTFQLPRKRLIVAELKDVSQGLRWKDANGHYVEWINKSSDAYGDPMSEGYVDYNDLIMNYDPVDHIVQAPGYASSNDIRLRILRAKNYREYGRTRDDKIFELHDRQI
jgi:hypothetical protein